MASSDDDHLRTGLSAVLPRNHRFTVHHLSTPPTKCDALYSAPPGERPDRTFCESHFLAVSIDILAASSSLSSSPPSTSDGNFKKQVLVLGIEVLIYTTAFSTTLFVSKADSTGYLSQLNLAKGTPSPIREICGAFIGHLVEVRRRKGIQSVVSLFARSQDQYLFPGSIKNSGKHVLDDRGLVKWWCRVLHPVVEAPPSSQTAKGYLVVPGLDAYETRAFIPRTPSASLWTLSHPLELISHYHREFDWVPPRCLIPRFPDDPKSRFRDELDEEAAKSKMMQTTGSWKSVKTLDTFWEMMAFRQECSSGRLTGFLWVVFDERTIEGTPRSPKTSSSGVIAMPQTPEKKITQPPQVAPSTTPRKLDTANPDSKPRSRARIPGKNQRDSKKSKAKRSSRRKTPKGLIKTRAPRIKTEQRNYLLDRAESTPYYYWPPSGRGEKIVSESDYKRIVELLLHLEFATLEKATSSTRRWTREVGARSGWGYTVTGTRENKEETSRSGGGQAAPVNNLSGLVKKKKQDGAPSVVSGESTATNGVNALGTNLVKKRSLDAEHAGASNVTATATSDTVAQPTVNVLSAGLVRKKPKT